VLRILVLLGFMAAGLGQALASDTNVAQLTHSQPYQYVIYSFWPSA
jgi:hypothetical protein